MDQEIKDEFTKVYNQLEALTKSVLKISEAHSKAIELLSKASSINSETLKLLTKVS